MNKTPEEYIQEPYTRILIPNPDETYSAEILEFSGCFADGNTANEAMENLNKSAKSWIEVCLEQDIEIPEPFMNQDFGGKIALRLPRSLHRQAVRFSERDGVSLNQFLVSAIAAKVGAEDSFKRLVDKLEQRISTTAINMVSFQIFCYTQKISQVPSTQIIDMPVNWLQNPKIISTEVRQDA